MNNSASEHLQSILAAIQDILDEAGVPGELRSNFEGTLNALPVPYRARVHFTLEIMRAFSDDPMLHAAVRLISRRASGIWSEDAQRVPSPPQAAIRMVVEPEPSFADVLEQTASAILRRVPLLRVA
jgi:hypothetical protein